MKSTRRRKLITAFVAKTIADLGYTGYVCHEYRPSPGSIR